MLCFLEGRCGSLVDVMGQVSGLLRKWCLLYGLELMIGFLYLLIFTSNDCADECCVGSILMNIGELAVHEIASQKMIYFPVSKIFI